MNSDTLSRTKAACLHTGSFESYLPPMVQYGVLSQATLGGNNIQRIKYWCRLAIRSRNSPQFLLHSQDLLPQATKFEANKSKRPRASRSLVDFFQSRCYRSLPLT
jgi:hypothetical protein